MKITLSIILLFLHSICLSKGLNISKDIKEVTIFYIDPSTNSFSGENQEEVVSFALEDYQTDSSIISDNSFLIKLVDSNQISEVTKRLCQLKRCPKAEMSIEVERSAAIVIEITYLNNSRDTVCLNGIYDQRIIFKDEIYKTNKNLYAYVLSLWPIELKLRRPLYNNNCNKYFYNE